jgi:hypothetical protein
MTEKCGQPPAMHKLKASLLYFALVMGAGFVLGVIRVPFLVPRLGERYAELLEMPFMFAVIVLAARHVVARFELGPARSLRLQVGFMALAMAVLAELSMVAAFQGVPVAQYIAGRDPVSGTVYLALLLVFALMPYLLSRRLP